MHCTGCPSQIRRQSTTPGCPSPPTPAREAQSSLLSATLLALGRASARSARLADGTAGDRQVGQDTSRILSIGGDVTEILYALKAQGKIIAVDSTSQFPAEALKEKPNVGYLRALSAEGVLSTNPSVIIASKDAGPPDGRRASEGGLRPLRGGAGRPHAGRRRGQDPLRRLGGRRATRRAMQLAKEVERDFAAARRPSAPR